MDAARARKLASRIQQIVAEALRAQVKDPRVGLVTITATRLTPDLRDATVYYTVWGDETARAETAAALASATGVLRSAVGRGTGVRFTPTLAFELDTVAEHAQGIEKLVERARTADEQTQQQAAHARFAGDSDPYRD